MTNMMLAARMGTPVEIDVCTACQAFWFDKYESLKLSPGSTLKLMKLIGENSSSGKTPFSDELTCPRCESLLKPTNDLQRNTRFRYWRCTAEHGRFIRFFEFLREKDFIRPLSPHQIEELRQNVQSVNCSSCGASIDLTVTTNCAHCGSPLSMLDMKQSHQLLADLKDAAEPRPVDPELPMKLALAKREVELWFGPDPSRPNWWHDASTSGIVEAGLSTVAKWLKNSGLL
jgi:hypothetical protein